MHGRTITVVALALAFLAVSGKVALAQDHGRGSNDQNHGQNNEQWNREHHTTFNDQDRQVTRDWYQQHRRKLGRGWRERDRLTPDQERWIQPGLRVDPRLRRQMYWVPNDLSRRYGPAPRGYRYAIIGGNLVMLDNNYLVHDVFRIDVQIR